LKKSILFFAANCHNTFLCGKSTEKMLTGTVVPETDFKFDSSEGPDLAAMVEGGKELATLRQIDP